MKVNTLFGPPGTGKTRALISLASGEVKQGLSVLMLSYTTAAASEMVKRSSGSAGITASTLHSVCNRLVGGGRASVVDSKKLVEFGYATGIAFAAQTPQEDYEAQEGDEFVAVLQYARNRIISPWEAFDHFNRPGAVHRFQMFLKSYSEWKATYGYIDFEDMLERASLAKPLAYPVVLLDEAQDCSPLQWAAFTALTANAERVYIAGDDDQAVYEWGGADPHGMIDFAKNNDSGYRVLDQSYRVPEDILQFVIDKIVKQINKRVAKQFKPRSSGGTIKHYGTIHEFPWRRLVATEHSSMALVRDRYRLKELQRVLHAEGVPYNMGGNGPYENKWATAARAVHKHNRGEVLTDKETETLTHHTGIPAASLPKTRLSLGQVNFPSYLREFYHTADFDQPIRLDISTIHAAKGKEADNVIVDLTTPPRVEEGMQLDRDAELRVMYVALTRGKHNLYLCGGNPLI